MQRVMQSPKVNSCGMMETPVNKTNAKAPPRRQVVTPIHVIASIPGDGLAYFASRILNAVDTPSKPSVSGVRTKA
jgi:hypothetical protein